MSIDGLRLGSTPASDMSPFAMVRQRMSLRLDATTSEAMGRPMRRAACAAKMLPKLPVGTVKATRRRGAPSATAEAT